MFVSKHTQAHENVAAAESSVGEKDDSSRPGDHKVNDGVQRECNRF